LNARQKRLFEDARKRNPNLKMPNEASAPLELTDDDLALLKQGVGDKSSRPSSAGSEGGESSQDEAPGEMLGSIVTYFEEKGFGFLRPESGGRDVFFHVSRLQQGQSTELVPGARVAYELGMDRTGKMAASAIRIRPPQPAS
jgi:CspA family cold shock protein